jgi:hypothetical protein
MLVCSKNHVPRPPTTMSRTAHTKVQETVHAKICDETKQLCSGCELSLQDFHLFVRKRHLFFEIIISKHIHYPRVRRREIIGQPV